jgi:hypothetical protein
VWGADKNPTWHGRELEPVLCKAGRRFVFPQRNMAFGSVNKTADETRYLLQNHYSHRYIAQQFSPYISWQFNPKFWLPPMSANCACWENIVLPLMINVAFNRGLASPNTTSRKRTHD